MRTSWGRLAVAGLIAAAVPAAVLWVSVRACGPDFEPEVFVPEHQPEQPKLYADGHLGVLQDGYYHADLVVAYRYLSGGKLSDAEKAIYNPPKTQNEEYSQARFQQEQAALPPNRWLAARDAAHAAAVAPGSISQDRVIEIPRQGYVERDDQLNCPDAAFNTAIATLAERTKKWGAGSAELIEWAKGQDAVFANCTQPGATPDPAQPGWPALLRQDRAYQIAAAKFYRLDFDGAKDDFIAIGKDKASPWSRWGEYLAARAEVRKAAASGKAADYGELANFDKDGLQAAQTRLLRLQRETGDAEIRHAAASELEFIEVHLDPAKRLDEAATALAGPQPDREFQQDLTDLDFLMERKVKGDSDLARWVEEMQPGGPPAPTSISTWQHEHTLPWLVAAMAEAPSEEAAGVDLLAAAAALKPDSPAFATVNYHRLELMLAAKKTAEARTLADTVIAGLGKESMASTRNAFLAERMRTARTFAEFLADAPRTVIESDSSNALQVCGQNWWQGSCRGKVPPQQFDADAADTMNAALPLAMWQEAATSAALPKNLRDAVAWAAWMRALGLDDKTSVKRMAALLPEAVRNTAGDSDGFPATLALLRNPGLRPYLEQGVQRSATYAQMDVYRDNWWCSRWGDGTPVPRSENDGQPPSVPPPAEFLSQQQRNAAAAEVARMNALPDGTVWLGERTIAYVKAHPQDKDAAEALALTVRATHLSCSGQGTDPRQKAISKEAFELLHSKYPKSEWALKTKYYY